MKTIAKDELFSHLGDFLKLKGIVLSEGVYSKRIQQGCNLLSDAINATQKTVTKARTEVDKKLAKLRASVHKATSRSQEKPPVIKPKPTAKAKAKRAGVKRKAATRKQTAVAAAPAKPKSGRKRAARKQAG